MEDRAVVKISIYIFEEIGCRGWRVACKQLYRDIAFAGFDQHFGVGRQA